MPSLAESVIYYSVKLFGALIRRLPLPMAVGIGRRIGLIAYYFDVRHRTLAYGNLKMAFAQIKSLKELKRITKTLFMNYGQNVIDLLRLPLLNPGNLEELVTIEGREHVEQARQQGKGVIMLAMHFGSWELASAVTAMLGVPYHFFVKPQVRHSRLDELLNSYRSAGGSSLIKRGSGTRDFIKALQNNEVVGMVVDQGGRDGMLVPFFGRQASLSMGAIRMGLKLGVPLCFAIIIREKDCRHRLVIHPPLILEFSDQPEEDIRHNLAKFVEIMEPYIRQYPADYAWFYKIWKYSKEAVILLLHDGRIGHLRQSQAAAELLQMALKDRGIQSSVKTVDVEYKHPIAADALSLLSWFLFPLVSQGRLSFLQWFLTSESYQHTTAVKPDFIISAGSTTAAVNYLFSIDQSAKGIVIQRPGILSFRRFALVILPAHDVPAGRQLPENVCITQGALNVINGYYLQNQREGLLFRYCHLKQSERLKIGFLLGGDTRRFPMSESRIRMAVHQLKEVAGALSADLLVTTSRRTPAKIENFLIRELKKFSRCQLLLIANRNNVPEAVGGILALADLVVVTGDSISMVSEAATAGKKTVVFSVQDSLALRTMGHQKQERFIHHLAAKGYVHCTEPKSLAQAIYDLAKNKIQTRILDDNKMVLDRLRLVV